MRGGIRRENRGESREERGIRREYRGESREERGIRWIKRGGRREKRSRKAGADRKLRSRFRAENSLHRSWTFRHLFPHSDYHCPRLQPLGRAGSHLPLWQTRADSHRPLKASVGLLFRARQRYRRTPLRNQADTLTAGLSGTAFGSQMYLNPS